MKATHMENYSSHYILPPVCFSHCHFFLNVFQMHCDFAYLIDFGVHLLQMQNNCCRTDHFV